MKAVFFSLADYLRIIKNSRIPFLLFLLLILIAKFASATVSSITVISDADLAVSNFSFSPQTIIAGANPGSVSFRLTNNGPSNMSFPNTRV